MRMDNLTKVRITIALIMIALVVIVLTSVYLGSKSSEESHAAKGCAASQTFSSSEELELVEKRYLLERNYSDYLRGLIVKKDKETEGASFYHDSARWLFSSPCEHKDPDFYACGEGCAFTLINSSSMSNLFRSPATLGFQRVRWEDLRVGDVVMVTVPEGVKNYGNSTFLIHAIISINNTEIVTYGYSNEQPDTFTTTRNGVVGKLCQIRY